MRYKEYSPVESLWTNELPKHWQFNHLRTIFWERKENNDPIKTTEILSLSAKNGVQRYSDKTHEGGNKAKEDLSKYHIAHPGDLIVNCMNIISGSVGLSEYEGLISPVYYALVIRNDDYNRHYYKYVFSIEPFQKSLLPLGKGILMHESSSGKLNTIRLRIAMSSMNNVSLPVPPGEEQDQIVRFLDWKVSEINKLIHGYQKEIKLLEEKKKHEIDSIITSGVRKKRYKYSGVEWIGNIPEDWEVIKIKWLFSEDDEKNSDLRYELLTFSRKRGLVYFKDVNDKDPSSLDLTKYRVVHNGQLLENRMQAWSGMFICVDKEGCVSPDYSVFNPKGKHKVLVKYYEYVFRNYRWVKQFADASRGIGDGFNRLYTPQFGSILTVLPSYEEQIEIVEYLESIKSKYDHIENIIIQEIDLLKEYRTRLISDVVTGQMDVRGIEIPDYIPETDDYISDDDENEEAMQGE